MSEMMAPPIASLTGANSGQILIIEVVCYNPSTMSSTLAPVDISNMPDLLDLVEEVEATKTPRELKRHDKVVAVLTSWECTTPREGAHERDRNRGRKPDTADPRAPPHHRAGPASRCTDCASSARERPLSHAARHWRTPAVHP